MNELPTDREPPEARYRRRLRGFGYHLAGYFVVIIVLVAANRLLMPETPWFVFPMVGWGSILAIHAAWVMGLFDILGPRR